MRELSLNVMDVAQNSISAKAGLIRIAVTEQKAESSLVIRIEDDGCGMTAQQVEQVQSPFYTTRTTRDVGLGVPFFKMACEMTGGSFSIRSEPGRGTLVEARFQTDHIDMTPLGDMNETILLLVSCNPDIDFIYEYTRADETFTMDTRQIREVLGDDVPLSSPDVTAWLREYLAEGMEALP